MTKIVTLTMNPCVDLASETGELDLEGRKTRCGEPALYPGGGGINVARGIASLGGEVLAIYPSGGSGGERLRRLLDGQGLQHQPVAITGAIRQNLSLVEHGGGRRLHLVFPGPELKPHEWRACAEALFQVDPPPPYVVLSGSLPPGVPNDFYAVLAHRCAERGSRVIVDASGPALESALAAGVFLIKPNRREFEQLFNLAPNAREPCIAKMKELVDRGAAQAVVVTVGDQGALLVSADRQVHLRPPAVEGESPVGAGDSLVAALVQRLATGGSLVGALADGVAAAAAAVKTGGTELYRPHDLRALREEILIEELQEAASM